MRILHSVMTVGLMAVLLTGAGCTGNQELNTALRELDKANERLNNLNRRVDVLQADNQMLTIKVEEQRQAVLVLQEEVERLQTHLERPAAMPLKEPAPVAPADTPALDVRVDDTRNAQQQAVGDFLKNMKAPAK